MYRVELKASFIATLFGGTSTVPNVPCGVERWDKREHQSEEEEVPNVPCGVESFIRRRLFCTAMASS